MSAGARTALRLELVHQGTALHEAYELAAHCTSAHADPHHARRLDPRGTYRWVLHGHGGEVLASRGYSAMFEEWQSTVAGQGDAAQGRYRETHTVPWVPGARLRIQRRTRAGFADIFGMRLPATAPQAPPPPARELRHLHGREGVTFLLVSEGYAADQAERFFADAARACALLQAAEPYTTAWPTLHVAALFVPSRGPGIPAQYNAATDTTSFASAYGTLGMARYLVCDDLHALHRALDGIAWHALVILANGTEYGGSGLFNSNACVATAMDPQDLAYVLPHELGHSFGGLGDEYFGKEVTYSVDDADPWEAWEPNISPMGPDGRVKWSHRLDAGTAVPTPWQHAEFCRVMRDVADLAEQRDQVQRLLAAEPALGRLGAFEGARYRARGMFRPEVDCRMFSKTARRFCAVCQETMAGALAAASAGRG